MSLSMVASLPAPLSEMHRRGSFERSIEPVSLAAFDDLYKHCTGAEVASMKLLLHQVEQYTDAGALEHVVQVTKQELRRLLIRYDMEQRYVIGDYLSGYRDDNLEWPIVHVVLRPYGTLTGADGGRRKTY